MIEASLIDACLCKDRKAQRVLYELVYPILIKVGKRYTHNEEDAVEIVTNSYLKILKKLDTIDATMKIEAWVRRIGINTAIDYYRSNKKYGDKVKLNAEYSYNAIENIHIDANNMDMQMEASHIYDWIKALPDTTREAINLFAIDGFNHQEISEMLGITNEMSRWHVHKARKIIAEKLDQFNNQTVKYKK
jgi:RNA polymerase sigma factor (sigma-70 family)